MADALYFNGKEKLEAGRHYGSREPITLEVEVFADEFRALLTKELRAQVVLRRRKKPRRGNQRREKHPMLVHATAMHEAGHAVAACALRLSFERVVLNVASEPRTCERTGLTNRWADGHIKTSSMPYTRFRTFKELPDGSFTERTVANCAQLRKRHEDYIVMLLAGREAMELLGAFGGLSGIT